MAQPTPYERQFAFSGQPKATWAEGLENELNAVKVTSDETLDNLELIQRDDGALRNGIVTRDSLAPDLALAGLVALDFADEATAVAASASNVAMAPLGVKQQIDARLAADTTPGSDNIKLSTPLDVERRTDGVMIVGSIPDDPSKAAANAVIWQAAFDSIPPGHPGFVYIKTPGTHYVDPVAQAGGRALTLVLVGDAKVSGSATVSGIREMRTAGPREAYFAPADPQYSNVGPVVETSTYGVNNGGYGQRHNHRAAARVDPAPGGAFTADIADAILAQWEELNGTFAFGRWDIFMGPKADTGNGYGVVGYELNVQNRDQDYGYHATRVGPDPWVVGIQLVPENQDFPADGSTGYNILATLVFGQSSEDGPDGYPARTYNAILGEANAIAPGGRLIRFAGGTEAEGLYRDPYAAVDLTNNWTCGIDFRAATFRGQDGLGAGHALRLKERQSIAFQRLTGDAVRPVMGVNFDSTYLAETNATAGVSFYTENVAGTMLFANSETPTPDSYIHLFATEGDGAQIKAAGSATNIDLVLTPQGAGAVKFGTWTSNADAAVNGYITIKDSAGNTRKIATIA